MNCLPSEDNPQEANLQIDKYLIDILRSASGKNDAAPKRGKRFHLQLGQTYPFQLKRY